MILYINVPILFDATVLKLSQEDVVQIVMTVHRRNVDQNSMPVFVCDAIGKSGFLGKNLKMAREPNFFLQKCVQLNQFFRKS